MGLSRPGLPPSATAARTGIPPAMRSGGADLAGQGHGLARPAGRGQWSAAGVLAVRRTDTATGDKGASPVLPHRLDRSPADEGVGATMARLSRPKSGQGADDFAVSPEPAASTCSVLNPVNALGQAEIQRGV